MMGYPEIGCTVLRYGERQTPSQRGPYSRIPVPPEAPPRGASPSWADSGAGGQSTGTPAVLRDEVRTRRTPHRPCRSAAFRKALSQATLVFPAAEAQLKNQNFGDESATHEDHRGVGGGVCAPGH